MPKSISQNLLRVFYIVSFGEDISKDDITCKVRPSTASEGPEAAGSKTAIEIFVKGNKVECHYYDLTEEASVEAFIQELTEDVPEVLIDAKEYVKLLANAASTAGLLPN